MVDAALTPTPSSSSGSSGSVAPGELQLRRESLNLPTQMPAPPDRYPAYLDNRVYQGMSGAVYPLPFHERIEAEAKPHEWEILTLSNPWVEIAIMPELGGRIAWGTDRTRDYDVFYRNKVLKPALVGLAGPWISGGIEFNWPQHHRPATFLPTSTEIEHEDDGSITLWCSDHDPFSRMKGMHGVRLRPDSAIIELRVRLFNRTDDVQTFLWWANVAARAGDDYQAFFPTDVSYVADHARRAITAFPAADRPYYGWDYPAAARREPGADRIDWYRNIRVPTSYMCLQTADDFFGGYDHGVEAGFVHVADHRISPGKKLWTWGNSPFGWAWDANLTVDDGPYVELMAGVYTDNQPDFAFLAPGETKTFSQFWYPFQDIGPVQQANVHAACALSVKGEVAHLGVAVTTERRNLKLELHNPDGEVLWSDIFDAGPGDPVQSEAPLPGAPAQHEVTLTISHEDRLLLQWTPRKPLADPSEPSPATEPPPPSEIASSDELYVTGLHLQQYRHSTRRPEPYWEEAIRRDPGDARCRVALAVSCLRRGEFQKAEEHLGHAISRLTRRNPNPYDSEAYYRLGQVLERTGRPTQALDAYGKAAWVTTWRDAAHLAMARIHAAAGQNTDALALISGNGTPSDPKNQARCLEVILLNRLGRTAEASQTLRQLRSVDPLDVWAAHLDGVEITTDAPTLLDVALEYASVGEHRTALSLLAKAVHLPLPLGQVNVVPLIHLHRADILAALGRNRDVEAALTDASEADPRWCFASRPADLDMLARLSQHHPGQPLVHRLHGHLLYHLGRREEAMSSWLRAVDIDDSDPVTRRNLAVASHNIADDVEMAMAHYARARELAPQDARLLYETDQLRKRRGVDPAERLVALEQERSLAVQRDDLTTEFAQLLTSQGRASESLDILTNRTFQPWEGGEGRVLGAWEEALLSLASAALADGEPKAAEEHLRSALEPPASLGEARHVLANHSALWLSLGDALRNQGRHDEAEQAWRRAAAFVGDFRTMAAVPYSDMTYYSVLANQRLSNSARAEELIHGLASWTEEQAESTPKVEFFATSLPSLLLFTDDLERRHRVEIAVLRAQVAVLRNDHEEAKRRVAEALAEDPNHSRARELARQSPWDTDQ